MIPVALVDDTKEAHEYFAKCLAAAGDEVSMVATISMQATNETFDTIEKNIADYKGPLMLFVDLQLQFDVQRKTTMLRDIAEAVENRSTGPALTVRPFLDDQLRSASDSVIDGVRFAWAALKNPNIHPLAILFSTKSPHVSWGCENLVLALAEPSRQACLRVRLANIAFSDAKTNLKPDVAYEAILKPLFDDFRTLMRSCASPVDCRDEFLLWIERQHDDILQAQRKGELNELVREPLSKLLRLSPQEWDADIWPEIAKIDRNKQAEVFLRAGSAARDRFGAVGGWLFSLAAFRASGCKRDWRDVFHVADLAADRYGWKEYSLTPPLTLNRRDSGNSLHDSIRRFSRLCDQLFEVKNPGVRPEGPCESVRLSSSGLEFQLAFDAWNPPAESLAKRVCEWRDGYLKRSTGLAWLNELEAGPHGASRALLDWQLATMLGDYTSNNFNDLFDKTDCWQLRLQRTEDGKTKVIFGGQ